MRLAVANSGELQLVVVGIHGEAKAEWDALDLVREEEYL